MVITIAREDTVEIAGSIPPYPLGLSVMSQSAPTLRLEICYHERRGLVHVSVLQTQYIFGLLRIKHDFIVGVGFLISQRGSTQDSSSNGDYQHRQYQSGRDDNETYSIVSNRTDHGRL